MSRQCLLLSGVKVLKFFCLMDSDAERPEISNSYIFSVFHLCDQFLKYHVTSFSSFIQGQVIFLGKRRHKFLFVQRFSPPFLFTIA